MAVARSGWSGVPNPWAQQAPSRPMAPSGMGGGGVPTPNSPLVSQDSPGFYGNAGMGLSPLQNLLLYLHYSQGMMSPSTPVGTQVPVNGPGPGSPGGFTPIGFQPHYPIQGSLGQRIYGQIPFPPGIFIGQRPMTVGNRPIQQIYPNSVSQRIFPPNT